MELYRIKVYLVNGTVLERSVNTTGEVDDALKAMNALRAMKHDVKEFFRENSTGWIDIRGLLVKSTEISAVDFIENEDTFDTFRLMNEMGEKG